MVTTLKRREASDLMPSDLVPSDLVPDSDLCGAPFALRSDCF